MSSQDTVTVLIEIHAEEGQETRARDSLRHAHMKDAAENGMSEAIQVLREHPKTTVLRTIGSR